MSLKPIISIIVPVYNASEYIRRSVCSILNQTFDNFELILIDDGSTDTSLQICEELSETDDRIVVIHQENSGMSHTRNVGLDIARGDYIGFVDADDWIATNMYETLYKDIIDYDADIVSIRYLIAKNENVKLPVNKENSIEILTGVDKLRRYLEYGIESRSNLNSVWSKLYKKELFKNIRFPEGKRYEDLAINYLLISASKKFVIDNNYLYYYFMNSTGVTRNLFKLCDYDLIDVTSDIYNMTKGTEIEHLGEITYGRSFYSLLLKILLYGVDSNLDEKEHITKLHKSFCSYYKILIRSNIPFDRKVFMPLVRVAPFSVRRISKLLH